MDDIRVPGILPAWWRTTSVPAMSPRRVTQLSLSDMSSPSLASSDSLPQVYTFLAGVPCAARSDTMYRAGTVVRAIQGRAGWTSLRPFVQQRGCS